MKGDRFDCPPAWAKIAEAMKRWDVQDAVQNEMAVRSQEPEGYSVLVAATSREEALSQAEVQAEQYYPGHWWGRVLYDEEVHAPEEGAGLWEVVLEDLGRRSFPVIGRRDIEVIR